MKAKLFLHIKPSILLLKYKQQKNQKQKRETL